MLHKCPFTNILIFTLNICDVRVTSIANLTVNHHSLLHFYFIFSLQYGSALLVPNELKYTGVYDAQCTAWLRAEGDKVQSKVTKVEKILRIYRVESDKVIMWCPHPRVRLHIL